MISKALFELCIIISCTLSFSNDSIMSRGLWFFITNKNSVIFRIALLGIQKYFFVLMISELPVNFIIICVNVPPRLAICPENMCFKPILVLPVVTGHDCFFPYSILRLTRHYLIKLFSYSII
jgi:hypothetical protein